MKKIFLALIFVFALSMIVSAEPVTPAATATTAAAAAQKPVFDNVISANVWPYLGAFFNLGYERNLLANISVRVRGEYWGLSSGGWTIGGYGVDLFYHPQAKGLDGFYFGPRFDTWFENYTGGGLTETGSLYWLGGQVGYRWINESGFVMALSLGAFKNIATSLNAKNSQPLFKDLLLPTFDFVLGWGF